MQVIKYKHEFVGAMLCLGLGILSGYGVSAGDPLWYISLIKPSFNPPSWVFAPVWTLLYLMMGITLGILWKNRAKTQWLLIIFMVQFALNLMWTPLFFYFQRIDLALLDVMLLWFFLIIFMLGARHYRVVFILFIPYVLWVSFAMLLNICLYQLN